MILQKMHAAEDIAVLVNCDVGWLVRGLVRGVLDDGAGLSSRAKWG